MKNWLIVIPARLASTRLPRKPLQMLMGKPLLQRVYENLSPLTGEGATIVAAIDSLDVQNLCEDARIPYVMTDPSLASGTDRCNQAAMNYEHSFVMNVQGDEPFVNCNDLKSLSIQFEKSGCLMGTMGFKDSDPKAFHNPNDVKIIVDGEETRALYFSRAGIPYDREAAKTGSPLKPYWRHLGIYTFTKKSLDQFCKLPLSHLEDLEKLEQLRAISSGWNIHLSHAKKPAFGIDTPEDLIAAEKFMSQNQ